MCCLDYLGRIEFIVEEFLYKSVNDLGWVAILGEIVQEEVEFYVKQLPVRAYIVCSVDKGGDRIGFE